MKQLTQRLRDGRMAVLDVPVPAVRPGTVLVRNHYSVISQGTESGTVQLARGGYLEKARQRPQEVKRVVDTLAREGAVQTYRAVMKRLDAESPLGYSCAGRILELGDGTSGFDVGAPVACGGLSASHAEIVCVPANLCVRLRHDADLRQATYNTLGATAMQGVRQADLRIGETCAVIGLGLIGQLTCLILRSAGIRSVGVDIDDSMVRTAQEHCADLALHREDEGIVDKIAAVTEGIGCDGVIICAASDSVDPINFAGSICRQKGTIVVVGAVPTGFDREPHFYNKELQVRMSCSYGPGRYDPVYEEKGIDYPPAYVRWTEKRNMQAFQDLIIRGELDLNYLTTHTFKLEEAPKAYDMLLQGTEPCLGILIEYECERELVASEAKVILKAGEGRDGQDSIGIAFIGAGSYAQGTLLPNIPREKGVKLKGVMTGSSTGSRSAGDRFGFEYCTSNEDEILSDRGINCVFVATRHDSHAGYVMKGLSAGKSIFVEKPLCLQREELDEISNAYQEAVRSGKSGPILMVGYNRRFSPLAETMKAAFPSGPMAMVYRVNAGAIPRESWIQDIEVGGGRIIGEVCHFVDFLTFMNGSLPDSVYATALRTADSLNDTLNVSLTYRNGSIGTISYLSNGSRSLPKERVEGSAHGVSAVMDDFKALTIYGNGRTKRKKLVSRDKGQKNEIRSFLDAIRAGSSPPVPFSDIYNTSRVTFGIVESIRAGAKVEI